MKESENSISKQLAKNLRDVHFGGNWTFVNLKDTLKDIDRNKAIFKECDHPSILALVYHIHYFVKTINTVLEENRLEGNDKLSFDHPEIGSDEEWEKFLRKVWLAATKCARLIESFPDSRLNDDFIDRKYGTYYRNMAGIIEHTHYHLGQIVILKSRIN